MFMSPDIDLHIALRKETQSHFLSCSYLVLMYYQTLLLCFAGCYFFLLWSWIVELLLLFLECGFKPNSTPKANS